MEKMEFLTNSADQTQQAAYQIAKKFQKNGGVIALIGDLGAGKTTFAQGFAKALGVKDKVISPTFVLVRQHPLPDSERTLFHIDLYRLEGKINPQELGLKELFDDPNNLVLIEWAEKIADFLPKQTLTIKFEKISDDKRRISTS
jgi:tRNA threonylcarbamoyladenosine biosynthesis protein TsaE